ncbi:hypothetical protein WJX73_005515 [Symbiochloris irregularis]|uniref:Uncharacterized protein n=1 Tax=Symbiochloris irregularis TaxID=706552 RepID=A0AAW1PLV5_9CHLO
MDTPGRSQLHRGSSWRDQGSEEEGEDVLEQNPYESHMVRSRGSSLWKPSPGLGPRWAVIDWHHPTLSKVHSLLAQNKPDRDSDKAKIQAAKRAVMRDFNRYTGRGRNTAFGLPLAEYIVRTAEAHAAHAAELRRSMLPWSSAGAPKRPAWQPLQLLANTEGHHRLVMARKAEVGAVRSAGELLAEAQLGVLHNDSRTWGFLSYPATGLLDTHSSDPKFWTASMGTRLEVECFRQWIASFGRLIPNLLLNLPIVGELLRNRARHWTEQHWGRQDASTSFSSMYINDIFEELTLANSGKRRLGAAQHSRARAIRVVFLFEKDGSFYMKLEPGPILDEHYKGIWALLEWKLLQCRMSEHIDWWVFTPKQVWGGHSSIQPLVDRIPVDPLSDSSDNLDEELPALIPVDDAAVFVPPTVGEPTPRTSTAAASWAPENEVAQVQEAVNVGAGASQPGPEYPSQTPAWAAASNPHAGVGSADFFGGKSLITDLTRQPAVLSMAQQPSLQPQPSAEIAQGSLPTTALSRPATHAPDYHSAARRRLDAPHAPPPPLLTKSTDIAQLPWMPLCNEIRPVDEDRDQDADMIQADGCAAEHHGGAGHDHGGHLQQQAGHHSHNSGPAGIFLTAPEASQGGGLERQAPGNAAGSLATDQAAGHCPAPPSATTSSLDPLKFLPSLPDVETLLQELGGLDENGDS